MKSNQKVLSILTVLALLFSLFPSSIFADAMSINGTLVSKTSTQAVFSGSASVLNTGTYRAGFAYSSTNRSPSRSDSNCTQEQNFSISTTGSALSIDNKTASGLSPSVGYYVRAYIYDSASGATQYSSAFSFTTDSDNVLPNVSTSYANYNNNGSIEAWGSVDSNQPINDRGFVYSSSRENPTLSDRVYPAGSGTGSFGGTFSISGDNRYYYVRAYATNSTGTAYGRTITLEPNQNQLPTVTTERVYNIDSYGADIDIYVSDNSRNVTERGVVYSATDSTPTTSHSHRTISGTTGDGSVHLNSLSSNTTYYVRAFARNSSGTAYGETKTFKTDSNYSDNGGYNDSIYSPDTSDVKEITETTAVVTGYVNKKSNDGYNIHERGFAYSSTNSRPTIHDSSAYDTGDYTGSYSKKLTHLSPNTTYYVRAYVTYGSNVYYGDTLTFTTGRTISTATVSVQYKTADNTVVGSQKILARSGEVLSTDSLLVPSGYMLSEGRWVYTVTGDAQTSILVKLNTGGEKPFMPSIGNDEFKPDIPITRQEVALILYNLSDQKMTGTPMTFGDVSGDHEKYAIDYVSAQKYMVGSNGNFYPENSLTRAEMATIMCNLNQFSGLSIPSYSDVSSSFWASNYIGLVSEKGIMNGYPDGTFKPQMPLTRAEACALFSIQEKRSLIPLGTKNFIDVPPSHWAYKYIMNAAVPTP